jgi:malyl-CoA/(S)-citramalyl-CoA lyase
MGGVNPDYHVLSDADESGNREVHLGNQWHFAMSRMIVACRAYGLRPIDGPFGDFSDPDGYLAVAKSFAALGGEGKWAIHPAQIELANQVFTPSEKEVDRARNIVKAMEEAAAAGQGAVSLDGRMIDAASIRQAEVMLQKVEQIERNAKQEAAA